jgi:hypothetical protein
MRRTASIIAVTAVFGHTFHQIGHEAFCGIKPDNCLLTEATAASDLPEVERVESAAGGMHAASASSGGVTDSGALLAGASAVASTGMLTPVSSSA